MTNFIDHLEQANLNQVESKWKGTFRDFLKHIESGKYPNIGASSHQRIEAMILSYGTEKKDYFGKNRISYKFFEDKMFGMEEVIDQIMAYIHSAARKTETSRRMLMVYGPPSAGKSDLVTHIKRGLEKFSRTDEGAIFALSDSRMFENPFLLVPDDIRPEFEKNYNIKIEGKLTPHSAQRLEKEFGGRFLEYPIERIFMSEEFRVGIGTWLPSDRKCLTENCTILTDGGLVKGQDLFPKLLGEKTDSKVYTQSGFMPIKACHDNGIRPVYELKLRGMQIEATDNHRFLTVDTNGDFEFTHVSDIEGKSLPVLVGSNIFGTNIALKAVPESSYSGRHHDVLIPKVLTKKLAKLAGYLIAEGSGRSTGIEFANQNESVNLEVQSIITEEFLIEPTIYYKTSNRKGNLKTKVQRGLVLSKQKFIDFVNINFGVDDNACEKEIPSCILGAPKEFQLEFLEGLFTGDGCTRIRYNTASITYSTCSKKLAQQLHSMLVNLGVFSCITSRIDKKYPKNTQYNLAIEGNEAKLLAKLLPFFQKNRNCDFSTTTSRNYYNYESFGSLHGLIAEIKSCIEGAGELIDFRYTLNSCNRRSPTRASLIKWRDHLSSENCIWTDETKRDSIINKINTLLSYRCIPVISKSYVGMKPVFDLEIDSKDHLFLANGLVSHNSQDLSELVGGIDFSKIQEYGDESDPRTYVMNGELNVANRGLMEFIEGLKAGEEFLRVLLTATQEKAIKAPRFGLISIDSTIFIHSNEEEFKNFMAEKKYEAYHDRMVIVRATYNSGIKNEVEIYKKLLSDSDLTIYHGKELISQGRKKKEIHLAPNTLESAAMFSVLTRLQSVDGELNLVKKMKLYDNQHVKGFKPQQVFDLKKSAPREGMFGVSPRFIIDQVNGAIATAIEEQRSFVTPLDVLRQLISGISHRDTFSKEEKNRYSDLVDMSRNEWNDLLRNDIQKAFFLSFEEEARVMCENYLIQIDMALSNEKPKDPVTGEEMQVDEKLLNSIESHLSISSSGKDDFRNEVLRFFGDAARKNKKVDYTEHSMLREAIQKSMFEERKGTIRMTVSSRNPDPESLRRLNDVIDRMVEHQGYTAASANELLKYATARLFDK